MLHRILLNIYLCLPENVSESMVQLTFCSSSEVCVEAIEGFKTKQVRQSGEREQFEMTRGPYVAVLTLLKLMAHS